MMNEYSNEVKELQEKNRVLRQEIEQLKGDIKAEVPKEQD